LITYRYEERRERRKKLESEDEPLKNGIFFHRLLRARVGKINCSRVQHMGRFILSRWLPLHIEQEKQEEHQQV